MVYFDHAATTDVFPEVISALAANLAVTGNASSLHHSGREARKHVEIARENIAMSLGALPSEVIFTAGGTEADNLAIKGLFWARHNANPTANTILASAIEHHAVLDPVQWLADTHQAQVEWIPVDADGVVDIEWLRHRIDSDPETVALVSVMWANNEVGTVQPLTEVVEIAHAHKIPVHTDAVQAVGSLHVDFAASGVDALSLSGHKIGAPIGIGALLLKREYKPVPVLHGGGQEREVRSGTLPTSLILALGQAVSLAVQKQPQHADRTTQLRDQLITMIESADLGATLRGHRTQRLPGNVHFTFENCEGDALLMLLDAAGVQVSTGSACTAGIPQPSHVLLAMGIPVSTAVGALRFSLGRTSTESDLHRLLEVLPGVVERARRAGKSLRAKV